MALETGALKTAIKAAFAAAIGTDDNGDAVAQDLADAIETFVKTATVGPGGLPVPLTAPSGGGPVTGTGVLS